MKKFLFFILAPILTSCDYDTSHDFYIENSCDQDISVYVNDRDNSNSSYTIPPQKRALICHGEIMTMLGSVTDFLNSIDIYKDSVRIEIDPMDQELWHFKPTGRFWTKGATSVLFVKPEHFPKSTLP